MDRGDINNFDKEKSIHILSRSLILGGGATTFRPATASHQAGPDNNAAPSGMRLQEMDVIAVYCFCIFFRSSFFLMSLEISIRVSCRSTIQACSSPKTELRESWFQQPGNKDLPPLRIFFLQPQILMVSKTPTGHLYS